jgi:hypothetical protein
MFNSRIFAEHLGKIPTIEGPRRNEATCGNAFVIDVLTGTVANPGTERPDRQMTDGQPRQEHEIAR